MQDRNIVNLSVDTIRTLSMDAVQHANSGHPGTPMALAPAAYALWKRHLRHNPANPKWFDRDRFVLSNGHASMLIYSLLHLSGYDLTLDEIKNFRQWGSKTPGHPEVHHTAGIETTTGPLGQGIMTAVGMAIAEAHLAARFNREGHHIVDHYTYVFCSDGDLMEGASHEAGSLAGHLGLGKLICLYDDNRITIEGDTDLAYSEDVQKRFESYGWEVIDLGEKGNDLDAISNAYEKAQKDTERPTMIILRTHIGYGAPTLVDTPEAHGSPLGHEEIAGAKQHYNYPSQEPFFIPEGVRDHFDMTEDGQRAEADWNERFAAYRKAHPELAADFERALSLELPDDWANELPVYLPEKGSMATRAVNKDAINALAKKLPWLVGGSADLEPSTKTKIADTPYFSRHKRTGRNFAWGIREHVMAAASSGMALHGGVRPFAATFFVFTDYARPAMRLSALMELPVIYVMTHDSIGLGEDGPTHQPIEHLASLRAMPNMTVIRPGDANEAVEAWKVAIEHKTGPVTLVLTRQGLPIIDRKRYASAEGVRKGGYVLSPEKGEYPDVILIATGSEVSLALEAQEKLHAEEVDARVVSFPSWELFRQQDDAYQESVLPVGIWERIAIEAGSPLGWHEWIGEAGAHITLDHFGASAPAKKVFAEFGFTVENIVKKAKALMPEAL